MTDAEIIALVAAILTDREEVLPDGRIVRISAAPDSQNGVAGVGVAIFTNAGDGSHVDEDLLLTIAP